MGTQFNIVETTISEIHDAMETEELTSEELVEWYIERIERYDGKEDGINSVVTINPNARARAADLDDAFVDEGLTGKLHGIPLVIKDQAMTSDMVTTFGSELFSEFVPERNATVVDNVRDEGAVIVGKTAMNDWAAGSSGASSIVGQTRNPYDLERDTGGSSSGTGAAVAANFATVGIGEDTGGSIRAPSSCCNLYGIRVTTGLISRAGLSPLVKRHDTAGPMARTVDDLIKVLDVLVGYDPEDPYTGRTSMTDIDSYEQTVNDDGLDGARIGVLRDAFGGDGKPRSADVNSIVEDSLSQMAEEGSEIIDPVTIPNLEYYLDNASLYEYQSKHDINTFLQSLEDPPVESIEDVYEAEVIPEKMGAFDRLMSGYDEPTEHADYWESVDAQRQFRKAIQCAFAEHDIDAIAFPDLQIPPRVASELPQSRDSDPYLINTFIGSLSSCPAVSIPGGFTDEDLPVGVELLGLPYSEADLLSMAAHYERISDNRRPPATTPAID